MSDNGQEKPDTAKVLLWLFTGSGLVGVFAAGLVSIASDAQIAIQVAEQHGQEILMIRGEINAIRDEIEQRTVDRFTGSDHARFEQYLERRLVTIEEQLNRY